MTFRSLPSRHYSSMRPSTNRRRALQNLNSWPPETPANGVSPDSGSVNRNSDQPIRFITYLCHHDRLEHLMSVLARTSPPTDDCAKPQRIGFQLCSTAICTRCTSIKLRTL